MGGRDRLKAACRKWPSVWSQCGEFPFWEILCPSQVFQTHILKSILCCPLEFLRVISEDSKKRNLLTGKQINKWLFLFKNSAPPPKKFCTHLQCRFWVLFLYFPMLPNKSQEVNWVSYISTPLWYYLLRDLARIHRTSSVLQDWPHFRGQLQT